MMLLVTVAQEWHIMLTVKGDLLDLLPILVVLHAILKC